MKFPVSDELLAHRAAAGRWEDFELLLRRCRNRVYRTCFRMVGNAEDAKDGAVRSLVRAYRASAVARFLSSRWSVTRSRRISARRIPTLDLSRLGDAHRRLLAAPPETEIRTQDSRALSEALALLLPFPVGAVDMRSEELWLVGGRPVMVDGVMVGALHYDWEGVRVSLFQVGARTLSPPSLRRILSRSDSLLVKKVGGPTSVAWSFGRTSCAMVAESVPAHLLVQFAFHAREKLRRA